MKWNGEKKKIRKFSNNEIMARGKRFSQIFIPSLRLWLRLRFPLQLQSKWTELTDSRFILASHRYNWNCKQKQCGTVQKVEIVSISSFFCCLFTLTLYILDSIQLDFLPSTEHHFFVGRVDWLTINLERTIVNGIGMKGILWSDQSSLNLSVVFCFQLQVAIWLIDPSIMMYEGTVCHWDISGKYLTRLWDQFGEDHEF